MERLPWILRARGIPANPFEAESGGEDTLHQAREEPSGEERDASAIATVVSGVVATVNLVEESCTLTDGAVVLLAGRTGDVAAVLTEGRRVVIDAEGIPSVDGLIASQVWIRAE